MTCQRLHQRQATLYINIGCPFAERAMLALNLRPVENVKVETMPTTNQFGLMDTWGVARGDMFGLFQGKSLAELHAYKQWYRSTINASGEVPALSLDTGVVVRESEIVAEYLDSVSECTSRRLVPADALAASKVRLAMKFFNAVPGLIVQLLKNQHPEKDAELSEKLSVALGKFAAVLEEESDFCVGATCTLADVHSVPFLHRFSVVLKHYRGYDMVHAHPRLDALLRTVMALPEYQAMVNEYGVTDARFVAQYEYYANDGKWSEDSTLLGGRGRSQLGK